MNLRLASLENHEKTDAVAIPVFEKEIEQHPAFRKAGKPLAALILKTAASEGFSGKRDQIWVFHTHQKLGTDRLLLLGLGPRSKYEPEHLRMASGSAARSLSRLRATSVLFDLRALPDSSASVGSVVEGILLGDYRYDRFRSPSSPDKRTPHLHEVVLLTSDRDPAKLKPILRLSTKIAEATNWARDLVNEPAASLTPTRLAEHAQKLAEQAGLEISVGDRE
ncbi:MAG TPA: M17 family peptidase N-terminal domain-containing protein, partial [Myxococcaceae bacterium]|nr:M17 family peptidase N-terminal domain-containing protein [Myxococcaceae bacterium]